MRRRFNADELIGDWFRPIVIAVVLLFHFTTCQANEPDRLQETNSERTVRDFQDVKQEVGYADPQRFGKVRPATLISWILIGTGIWILIAIFLFAFYNRSPTDKVWLKKEDEDTGS